MANTSFKAIIDASGGRVAWSDEDQSWILESPAGDEVAFSSDFSRNGAFGTAMDMDKPDAEFSFDAAPFVAAGLAIEKMPMADGLKYEIEDGKFMIHFELGVASFSPEAKKSMVATFAEIVRTERDRIGYHEKLDHYGIKLGDGNMFEWAKDRAKNDKDIVWVLNPEPFIAAGVDPSKIEGWAFAKVELKDDAGKTILVDKLLKPFDLR
ncbi:MAG: hypothetical protein Q8M76_15070 [Spirochaetaceae bacterium]|nr:hypothetical protein [Spirochaetaceae bacterium]